MRLTHFFLLISIFCLGLLIFLQPEQYDKGNGKEIAQLEIEDFTIYELTTHGVKSVLSGISGHQYKKYYDVENAHYIENKKPFSENLYADYGRFKKNVAVLRKNVRFFREDGISFESDHALYNTRNEILEVKGPFVLTQNENVIYAKNLRYESLTGEIFARNVDANYYLEEK